MAVPIQLEKTRRGEILCRVTLGLTLYFRDAPTRDEIVRAYSIYRRFCPPNRRRVVTTVRRPMFLPLESDDVRHVYRSLADQDRRRDEGVVVWDGRHALQWSFWMQGYVPDPPTRP